MLDKRGGWTMHGCGPYYSLLGNWILSLMLGADSYQLDPPCYSALMYGLVLRRLFVYLLFLHVPCASASPCLVCSGSFLTRIYGFLLGCPARTTLVASYGSLLEPDLFHMAFFSKPILENTWMIFQNENNAAVCLHVGDFRPLLF
jgi:hypothetical protein